MSSDKWSLDPLRYGHVFKTGHVSALQRVQYLPVLDISCSRSFRQFGNFLVFVFYGFDAYVTKSIREGQSVWDTSPTQTEMGGDFEFKLKVKRLKFYLSISIILNLYD